MLNMNTGALPPIKTHYSYKETRRPETENPYKVLIMETVGLEISGVSAVHAKKNVT